MFEAETIYIILAIMGVGVLTTSMLMSMLGFDFFELDNPYLFKIFVSTIAGIGLGGIKWGLAGAFLSGLSFAALMGVVIYIIIKLGKADEINLSESIGTTGSISMNINDHHMGKALIVVGSALREVDVISKQQLSIGDIIIVTKVLDSVFEVEAV